ncbi:pyrimidine-specific ribonucleoside hydrolase RihA [Actinoplanes italicus]|uniref:Purine nucleosidase/pyrimidine-specific ribonucleoside hydrolase n=1 Tax=Actinoplanes italicus TaxID=113567 RepID=A0A2T0KIP3_9ACTN|nr:purine nucleosidase/pyrimidine-specific ribonucleoside hydrolase [Actinoplanes italicus]GIE29884.1 pyrimidine-specific ribonucleoside hydrolase RihA [Actinoplanes italicus]
MIIDCDPGHDDALALLLAVGDPRLDVRGVTTVAGNQTLDKTTTNALRILGLAGVADVPVAAGHDRPLSGELTVAEDIHGASGLDGPDLDVPVGAVAGIHAVELMRRLIAGTAEPVTLIATGPLTNVASLLRDHPEVRPGIDRIVFMGGSTERGNTTPYGEFNIVTDPEAADIVLRSGLPVTMIGLNVTHQALATPEVIAEFRAMETRLGDVCAELMVFFAGAYRRVFGFDHPPVHDPIAVAQVIDPAMVRTVTVGVAVELTGTYTRGATVVDLHGRAGDDRTGDDRTRNGRTGDDRAGDGRTGDGRTGNDRTGNDRTGDGNAGNVPRADVAVGLDVDAFWRLLMSAVRRLSG